MPTMVAVYPTPTLTTETAVPKTVTPQPTEMATEVATAIPTVFPTVTAPPQPTATAEPMSIVFDPGAISKMIHRTLSVGTDDEFTFWAAAGQFTEISISSSNNSANFSLVGLADGLPYKRFVNEDRTWADALQSTGDYRLTVTSLNRPIEYTLTVTIYPLELALPQTLPELAEWIGQQRQNGTPAADVQETLAANGWLADWQAFDLDGDEAVEWIVVLQEATGSVYGPEGDMVIVNQNGLLYRHYARFAKEGYRLPEIQQIVDLTGDGLPEVTVMKLFCGAHTCTHFYDIVGAPAGAVQSLVPLAAGSASPAIAMMSSDVRFEDWSGNGRLELIQHGGFISSVGAGPYQRGYTEVWAWQPAQNQFGLIETFLDPSNYRFHLLYEANDAFAAGEYETAIAKYTEVVENPNLDDGLGLTLPESTYDPSRQFAAFRLMLTYLLLDDMDNAQVWSGWLYSNYPNGHITDGVIAFWEDYNFNQSVSLACTAVTNILNTFPNPTGSLADLGYALPSLNAESVCPIN
ncbi:hypothetical protein [Candidatus Leptofilum sp.]|uniref:hypothetical protein n=1 Tax=Candidatus Leptofilum sp. TaxID=3241576 RepID=UPI003B5B8D04